MIFYTTGKGTYKGGEVGAIVETDEATGRVLIEKGYLSKTNPLKPKTAKEEPPVVIESELTLTAEPGTPPLITHKEEFELVSKKLLKRQANNEKAKAKAREKTRLKREAKAAEAEKAKKSKTVIF